MSFITFGERHRLGHAEIDAQHVSLFAEINRLHDLIVAGAGRQALGGQLALLREQTALHFRLEEDLMQQGAYPGFREHSRLHDELMQQVQDLEIKQQRGSLALSLPVMNFLKDWLAHHITVEDRRLAEFLEARES